MGETSPAKPTNEISGERVSVDWVQPVGLSLQCQDARMRMQQQKFSIHQTFEGSLG